MRLLLAEDDPMIGEQRPARTDAGRLRRGLGARTDAPPSSRWRRACTTSSCSISACRARRVSTCCARCAGAATRAPCSSSRRAMRSPIASPDSMPAPTITWSSRSSSTELAARIRALLRRQRRPRRARRRVRRHRALSGRRARCGCAAEPVALSPREFALLEALLARPGAHPVARAARGKALRLERGGREQRGRSPHPCAAHASSAPMHPQRARRGLDDRESGPRTDEDPIDSPRSSSSGCSRGPAASPSSAAAFGTYMRARDEANALFDYQLQQMAASLTGVPFAGSPPGTSPAADALVVQVWDRNGVQVYLSQPQRDAAAGRAARVHHRAHRSGRRGASSARSPATRSSRSRSRCARGASSRRAWRCARSCRCSRRCRFSRCSSGSAIARGLSPLDRVAVALAERSPVALRPLDETGLPSEVQPLVHALNGLLDRLDRALDAQRAFIADAAHELRTPLTAVHLQAQLAERATDGRRAQRGACRVAAPGSSARRASSNSC